MRIHAYIFIQYSSMKLAGTKILFVPDIAIAEKVDSKER
jgi:hypothetical protein